jgi:hypothetical protein
MDNASGEGNNDRSSNKIRGLWIGFGVYFLIMLNGFRYAYQVPFQLFAIACAVNMAIVISFIVLIRNEYKKSRNANS